MSNDNFDQVLKKLNRFKGILTRFWGVLTTFKDWTLSFQHCLNILNTEMGYILADDMTYSSPRLRHRKKFPGLIK